LGPWRVNVPVFDRDGTPIGRNSGACESTDPAGVTCRLTESLPDGSVRVAGTWYVNGRTNDPIIAAVLDVRSGTGDYEGVDGYALFGYEVDHFYLTMYLTDPARESRARGCTGIPHLEPLTISRQPVGQRCRASDRLLT